MNKIIIFDIDSLLFSCSLNVETIEEAIFKYDEIYMSIINTVEDDYIIDDIYNYGCAIGNYRKTINIQYKANRKSSSIPELLNELKQYVLENYNVIQGHGLETDDLVARKWKENKENSIIISIDKDYRQFPALIYNYHYLHKRFYDITEAEAKYNFAEQLIVGDENINYCKGYGKAYAKKLFKDCESDYQYIKQLFILYKKIHKSKARERLIDCWRMLALDI